jgi:hypothetical protein
LFKDFGLIEASFAAQYGIRLRRERDIRVSEFFTLLEGLLPETPLGRVLRMREEERRGKKSASGNGDLQGMLERMFG